jgi:hypothetical protein
MTAEKIKTQAVCRQVFLTHGGNQQRSGIIIGAVAMGAIGDGIVGMLQDAGIIGKGFQVIELDLRKLEIRDGLDIFNIGMPGPGVRVRFCRTSLKTWRYFRDTSFQTASRLNV